ncbi:glycosyltransferase [Clostridium sp.]|uniref:glycosyltransferase n=1 Tax=Clostridium sp. TaxID=1506 RepID=UPI002636F49F|nr:glycosyltransferase [Clostridium sp.]
MSKDIVLSIVVPVYNVEKYLDICLESIIKNYQQGVEVVLVDDGSKDNSSLICDRYIKDYEYINVIHKENGGLSSARNAGIKKADGKYIWFVDSDDYIKDGSIDKIIDLASKNTDLIIGSYCGVFPDGKIDDDYLNEPLENENNPYVYFHNKGSASYAAVRFITKKELIIGKNLFFIEGIYHEDEEWSPRVLCSAKTFVVINESIYNYRVGNAQSIMGMDNPKKVYDKIFISKSIYDKIENENLEGDIRNFLQYRIEHNFITALNEVGLYSGEEKKKMIKKVKDNIYLLNNIKYKKTKLVKALIGLIGVNNTSRLLRLRNQVK